MWYGNQMPRLVGIARRYADGQNPNTKFVATGIYEMYDQYFAPLVDRPISLLEVGVAQGESLKTFSDFFPGGTIVGVDVQGDGLDFSRHPNVRFEICDQRDGTGLADVCRRNSPNGFDVIIDDASHYGAWSLMTYNALFPFLKPGGLYIVEDWATGYWMDWPDGALFADQFVPDGTMQKRVPSHDFGMVGFIKYLVDEVASRGIRPSITAPLTRPNLLGSMHVHKSIVVLVKAV